MSIEVLNDGQDVFVYVLGSAGQYNRINVQKLQRDWLDATRYATDLRTALTRAEEERDRYKKLYRNKGKKR